MDQIFFQSILRVSIHSCIAVHDVSESSLRCNLVVCTHGGIVFPVRSYLDFQGKYYTPTRGFGHANSENFFLFKVLKSSTLNWSSRENPFSNQPIQGFSKETLPKQNKPLLLIWLHNGKRLVQIPNNSIPFLMQVMAKSKWIVGNLTRIHIGWPLSPTRWQQPLHTTSHYTNTWHVDGI